MRKRIATKLAAVGAGPEGAARAARYRTLAETAEATGCRWVATGHTLDDQAETVLLQLLRGTGPDGLAGMPVRDGWLLRPLLGVRREETRRCCRELELAWREDETNQDQRLLRNAVRLRVLPLLEELRPGSTRTLARTAELARAERDWLDPLVATTLDGALAGSGAAPAAGTPTVALRTGALGKLPAALARRVVRAACRRAGCGTPAAETVDAIVQAAGEPARGGQVGWPGGRAWRQEDLIVLAREMGSRRFPDDWSDAPSKPHRPGGLG